MITRRNLLALLSAAALPAPSFAASPAEPEALRDKVKAGALPPMAERLPKSPRVIRFVEDGRAPGRYGRTIRMLIGSQRDIRYMPIFGYSRLVGFDRHFNFEPDILDRYEVEDEKVFTLYLRPGHRWSDGSLFTAEDFRYVWEDMFHDKKLFRGGIPTMLRVKGEEPKFEIIDELTVRYSWKDPNPDFLLELASPSGTRLMLPAAYLKQFHRKYQAPERLEQLARQQHVEDWVALHQKMARTARPENPDLPSLDPWCNTTAPPAGRFVFERNPYFHRIDENGLQLPYIDRIFMDVGSGDLIAAKTASGDSDLQVTNLAFSDYTFLKSAERSRPISVKLWKRIEGARIAIIPNLNCTDPVWKRTVSDVRVRRALSLAINRDEINKAVFFGLGQPSANAILPVSPLFRPEYKEAWAAFDPDRANAMLDEAGLPLDPALGLRRLPDGRPCTVIVETTAESGLETDVLELVTDNWRAVGFHLFAHTSHRELFRQRITNGETVMALWWGLDNGVPTADMSPRELAPTSNDQIQWPLWGLHQLSGGGDGRAPDLEEAKALLELYHGWRHAGTRTAREAIWHEMLSLFTQQVFTIGIVNSVLHPVVHDKRLRNIPADGLFGFDPTAYLGVYMPDGFWYDGEA